MGKPALLHMFLLITTKRALYAIKVNTGKTLQIHQHLALVVHLGCSPNMMIRSACHVLMELSIQTLQAVVSLVVALTNTAQWE